MDGVSGRFRNKLRKGCETGTKLQMPTKTRPLQRRECALEGCTRKFTVPIEGRPKIYCSDLHRAMASKQRRRTERATAFNSMPDGQPLHLVMTTPRGANTPQAEGAAVANSTGAAHQRGSGTSTVRYSTHVVMHVREEGVKEVPN